MQDFGSFMDEHGKQIMEYTMQVHGVSCIVSWRSTEKKSWISMQVHEGPWMCMEKDNAISCKPMKFHGFSHGGPRNKVMNVHASPG